MPTASEQQSTGNNQREPKATRRGFFLELARVGVLAALLPVRSLAAEAINEEDEQGWALRPPIRPRDYSAGRKALLEDLGTLQAKYAVMSNGLTAALSAPDGQRAFKELLPRCGDFFDFVVAVQEGIGISCQAAAEKQSRNSLLRLKMRLHRPAQGEQWEPFYTFNVPGRAEHDSRGVATGLPSSELGIDWEQQCLAAVEFVRGSAFDLRDMAEHLSTSKNIRGSETPRRGKMETLRGQLTEADRRMDFLDLVKKACPKPADQASSR